MMNPQINSVLAATDFSKPGNNAVMVAINICKQHNAVLHLLHVAEAKYVVNVAEFGLGTAIVCPDDQEARSQLYNMYERILKEHDIMVRIHMPKGNAQEEICLAAKELQATLVVMGAHSLSGLKGFLAGSIAYNVIKNTTAAVITVPEGFVGSFKKILFPIRPVKGIVEKFRCIQPFLSGGTAVHIAMIYKESDGIHTIDCNKELSEILMCLHKLNVPGSIDIYPTSSPAAKVLELCHAVSADLLAINATFDYHWSQFFSGPYTQQVVNHAAIPVLSFHHTVIPSLVFPYSEKVQDAAQHYHH